MKKTNIAYLILALITTICISCESHNQPEVQDGSSILKATYTVITTTDVKESGTAPKSSDYNYERTATTGEKGQMTAGDSTRLELRGWDDYIIKEVELQMRSNMKSGAGSLSVVVGMDTLWKIDNKPFCDVEWAGKYSKTVSLPIKKSMNVLVGDNESIEIKISATENSLYISSYTIYYEQPSSQCYTIDFLTGLDTCPPPLTQSAPNQPLILPAWQDTAEWYFLGWTEVEVLDNKLVMPLLSVGETYLPRKNTTLWSVYSNHKENRSVSEYKSGQYAIAMYNEVTLEEGDGIVMSGSVKNYVVATQLVEMQRNNDGGYNIYSTFDESVFYYVQFNEEDSTLTLKHNTTDNMIGHKDAQLSSLDDYNWRYKVLNDGSLVIYYSYNYKDKENDYALYMGFPPNATDTVAYVQQIGDIANWQQNALWLFPKVETKITTFPFGN